MMPANTKCLFETGVRVRPPSATEDVSTNVIPNLGMLHLAHNVIHVKADHMLGVGYSQELLFENVAKRYIDKFLRAEDSITLVAFGPPGSGKTFTLFGPGVQLTESAAFYGIYPRLATYLFSQYDPSLFDGEDPRVTVSIAFYEIRGHVIKDLITNTVLRRCLTEHLTKTTTTECMYDIQYETCTSAREMIQWLNVALNNSQPSGSHMFANIILSQPVLQDDGNYSTVITNAVFADVGNTVMEMPQKLNPYNQAPVYMGEDQLVISYLAQTFGGRINVNINTTDFVVPAENHLGNALELAFTCARSTLVLCCLPPNSDQLFNSGEYFGILHKVIVMSSTYRYYCRENIINKSNQMKKENTTDYELVDLIRMTMGLSVTNEEQEKIRACLQLKKESKETEDFSFSSNAQSAGHLECIEEVTESEEEIASSDEKMSESPVSMDNSISESDQEEGDSKVCQLSDNDFFSSLDTMCVQFNSFVDKFVDSFKAKTSLSPAKERKRDYSAARRGGMPELPKVNELQAQNNQNAAVLLDHFPTINYSQCDLSKGCIKKTTYTQSKTCPEKCPAKAKKMGKLEDHFHFPEEPEDELQKLANHDPNEKYISWSVVRDDVLEDVCIESWLDTQHEEFIQVKENWSKLMKGSDGKAADTELKKQMYYALCSIDTFMQWMRDSLASDAIYVDNTLCGINHIIRVHRLQRQHLLQKKSVLESTVKHKTASEEEFRDHLIADEMIEMLDSCMELLNCVMMERTPQQTLPDTPVCRIAQHKFKHLTSLEMKHLIYKYFLKVVDLRENSKLMENTIAEYELKLDVAQTRINTLTRALQEMRTEQSHLQAMAKYTRSPEDGACGGHSSHLALAEGSKSRRGPSIPHQNLSKLQVNRPPAAPTKVTFKHNKLIIEKPNNQK